MRRPILILSLVLIALTGALFSTAGQSQLSRVLVAFGADTSDIVEVRRPPVGLGTLASSYSLSFNSISAPHDGGNGGAIAALGQELFC